MKTQTSSDQRTILTLLDICGSCIVDICYNHLYDRAIAVHERTSTGITECYRQAIAEYVGESSNPKFYSVLLNTLHHYVRMSTIYNDISYSDCVSLYSSLFVPQMYAASLTAEQKINILSMIIGNTVRAFINEINETHIACIIDDHNDPINIEVLQDAVLKVLMNERDESYSRFIDSQKPTKKVSIASKPKAAKSAKPIMVTKLTDAFKKSITDRVSLKKKNSSLAKKNRELVKQFQDLKSMFLNQIAIQKEQTVVIEKLKRQIDSTNIKSPLSKTEEEEDDDALFNVQYVI